MTATSNPYGMRPAYSPQGDANARGIVGGIASGYATTLLKGQPVTLGTDGTFIAATAGANDFYGIFAGISYVDANGVLQSSDKWVGGTTYTNGQASPTIAWVWDDANMVFSIQADGSLASSVGGQVNFSNITAGSTTTGLSACTVSASSLTTSAQGQLRIVALDPTIGNAWGDAFTIVQVQFARSQYVANKVAV